MEPLPNQLIELLRLLSDQIVSTKLAGEQVDATAVLNNCAPLFAALHAVNRDATTFTKECKVKTQEARLQMDSAHLRLQNLLYERNHLEREITSCEEYESQYQKLPLLPEEEFLTLVTSSSPPAGLPMEVPEDSHELMLARLNYELTERQRLEDEKRELISQKAQLAKENQAKKDNLDQLEKEVDKFVTSAKAIQSKMHLDDDQETKPATATATIA